MDAPSRSDQSFFLRADNDHHHTVSPLINLNFGLVSQCVLDYMHLICLGVVRKIIFYGCLILFIQFVGNSVSPLINLNFGLVSQCVLDYMHLICLGIVRKIIFYGCLILFILVQSYLNV